MTATLLETIALFALVAVGVDLVASYWERRALRRGGRR